MVEPEARDIGIVIAMVAKTLNPPGNAFTSLQVPGSMAVAFGSGPIQ